MGRPINPTPSELMQRPIAAVSLAIASILVIPLVARAQIGIESLFKEVTDVSLSIHARTQKG